MQKVYSAERSSELGLIDSLSQSALYLRAHASYMNMLANYSDQLEKSIFSRTVVGCDSKRLNKHRRILRSTDAYKTLAVIWKESEFITENDLASAQLRREYQGRHLTSHSLAVSFSELPQQVAKLNSRIRNIALAAAAFQLVDRDLATTTKVILKGTNILHEFMSDLSAQNIVAFTEFASLLTTTPAAMPSGNLS